VTPPSRYYSRTSSETYVIATTVLDPRIKNVDFARLYEKRGIIEEYLKNFKISMDVDQFYSKSVNGVDQEIYATSLLWNLTVFLQCFIPDS
jgi:hypothetical protein